MSFVRFDPAAVRAVLDEHLGPFYEGPAERVAIADEALVRLLEDRGRDGGTGEALPLLVIVSGLPGSGKSTLARRIAPELGLPLLDRDELKDAMFDVLGWSDRAWSRRVGATSWELVYLFAHTLLSARCSLVLDSNFDRRRHPERLRRLKEDAPHRLVEVCCSTAPGVNWERFHARWRSGGRHPGHVPGQTDPASEPRELGSNIVPVGVADVLIEVDTTDLARIDHDEVVRRIPSA